MRAEPEWFASSADASIGHWIRAIQSLPEDMSGASLDELEMLSSAHTLVLHGDFATWNLLFVGGRLTGVLDFEFSHLDYRVADFALAWRGEQDEVLKGYEEVERLTEQDWDLLIPVFWAWLFIGMTHHIDDILQGRSAVHGFDWQLKHLLRRSEIMCHREGDLPPMSS